jgi:U3 small nucleolar RNA-associated protein 20
LIDVATSVGAAYFHFVLEELRRALKRGYQEHVLGHTIHALLLAVLKQFEPGAIDYCLSDLINLLLTEINGTLADDKAATELKQSLGAADMKGSKAPDSFELLARGIKFANVRTLGTCLDNFLMIYLVFFSSCFAIFCCS